MFLQQTRHVTAHRCSMILVVWGLVALCPSLALAQYGAVNGEWPTYAGDLGGTKYSPLDQIDASNFSDLEIAWRWRSADADLDLDTLRAIHPDLSILNLRVTPLMVDGVVYAVTPMRLAVALDAGTGAMRWIHNPQAIRSTKHAINTSNYLTRGLAYWAEDGEARIFYGTPDGYLLALDARTGEPVLSFGRNGRVDLTTEIPRGGRGTTDHDGNPWISITSAPIVARAASSSLSSSSVLPLAWRACPSTDSIGTRPHRRSDRSIDRRPRGTPSPPDPSVRLAGRRPIDAQLFHP